MEYGSRCNTKAYCRLAVSSKSASSKFAIDLITLELNQMKWYSDLFFFPIYIRVILQVLEWYSVFGEPHCALFLQRRVVFFTF
jgi:hypothetical protein